MSKNIRWDESVKANVLSLVAALLAHAEEAFDDAELKTAVRVEWITENQLRVTGEKLKQTPGSKPQIEDVGTTKKHLLKLIQRTGYSFQLTRRHTKSDRSQSERELKEVQTVLDCLNALGLYESEKSAKNRGYWKFKLTLKHRVAV
ncbi:MAG: hypothetical protein SVX43_20510 [Cyanobacteriota bacterium]|nr:hypothetical protein [Cyanobacteriota bacterium]